MKTKITTDFLKPYFNHQKKHKAYDKTVQIYKDLKVHADGEKPGELLTERRPSESDEIKAYREKIYVEITKSVVFRINTSLSKIRKSPDWNIKYDEGAISNLLGEGQSLKDYCEENFPYFKSITNWTFNVLLKNYLIDSNALCLVMPLEFNITETSFYRPFSFIFNSPQVIDYVQDDYAIILSTDKCTYSIGNGTRDDGDIFYVVTMDSIQRWEQINSDKTFELKFEYKHKMDVLPVFKLGGVFKEALDTTFIFESRINGVVPFLKEAVREYSDLQAEVVQHIHSTMWAYNNQECNACGATGKVKKGTSSVKCKDCNGTGAKIFNPYSTLIVNPNNIKPGANSLPTPPAGYIQKDVEIVKVQDERVENHKYKALASINMEFLMQTPLNQSGRAKEVDRDELNVFVNSVAEDIVAVMDKIYYMTNEMRNSIRIKSKQDRLKQLPKIAVPEKFDLLSSSYLMEEIKSSKEAKVNPTITKYLEIEYAGKKFNNDPEAKKELELVFKLDPLPTLTEDEKASRLMNKGITMLDYVISSNINAFVKRALEETKEFSKLDFSKQVTAIKKFADEKIKENSAAAKVLEMVKDDDEFKNEAS